jgi:hypothetical protein
MSQQESFEERTVPLLVEWSQRISRRRLLSRVGNFALKAAGVSLLPLLPADRAFAQFGCSSDWQTCGMHGFLCKACCNQGASYASCPQCTNQGGAWEGCCRPDPCAPRVLILYYDCCGTKSGYTPAQAAECQGTECPPGGGAGTEAYCGSQGTFRCTIIVNQNQGC